MELCGGGFQWLCRGIKLSRSGIPEDTGEKVAGDISFGAFSNPSLKKILRKFGKNAFARSSACMEFEAFLRRINARGKCCVEIGTFYGITAVVLSQFFDRVVCVSLDVPEALQQKHEIVRYLGIKSIRFFDVANNVGKRKLIQQLDFDFAYSDGDHAHDARSDFDLVKRCGRVLFHEYWPLQPPVWNLVNALPQSEVTRAAFDCFAYWQRHG